MAPQARQPMLGAQNARRRYQNMLRLTRVSGLHVSTVLFGFLREDEEAAAFFRGQQWTIKQVTVTMIPKPNE